MELFGIQDRQAAPDDVPGFCTHRGAPWLLAWCTAGILSGCALPAPPAGRTEAGLLAAWVEMVPQPQARAVMAAGSSCPTLVADGYAVPMTPRAAASRPSLRAPAGSAASVKPAVFAVEVCAADLPDGVRRASVEGRNLPVPPRQPQRIVVIGDSGCRLKGTTLQDCNDPQAWPFARVAAAAAAVGPDLVIHVGDYHYRETPCPGAPGCAGPWGYGWDAWSADFFVPAAPLLGAAPWVLVRGDHELCSRAGQGWSHLLAPEPYRAERSCDNPEFDDVGDYSEPYAVPLGSGAQIVVLDSARAGNVLNLRRPQDALTHARYVAQMKQVAALIASPGTHSWMASHHPVLGFAPRDDRPSDPYPGNAPLQAAMHSVFGGAYFPAGVALALHGHVHNFQAIDFSSGQPPTLVAGNGGDKLADSFPSPFPKDLPPAPGVVIDHITTASSFGFLLLEADRQVVGAWSVHAYRADGSVLAECQLRTDRTLRCQVD